MPKKNGYDWSDLSTPPPIELHSIVKHEIVCDYLSRYIQVCTKDVRIDHFRINLIDGFCGGGRYLHEQTGALQPGSPILLIKTINAEEARINTSGRKKPFKLDASYYFVEIDKGAIEHLKLAMVENELDSTEKVRIINGDFISKLPEIIKDIKKRSRSNSPKNIFLLDQYGYKDVPFSVINQLFTTFPQGTEVILTYSTDSLINHLSTHEQCVATLKKYGLENLLDHPELADHIDVSRCRLLIEQLLYEEIKNQCGAGFYTPFFIRSDTSNRAYWLVHLSSHPTARNQMLLTHWEKQNNFVHHGGVGLNMMLGYEPTFEALADQQTFEFYFDDNAKSRVIEAMKNEIPDCISGDHSIKVDDLVFRTCNSSPATLEQYKQALFELQDLKVLRIKASSGRDRRSANAISFSDHIVLNHQLALF